MTDIRAFEEHDLGLSWIMDEALTRTSHALVDEGRVWLVDPVDAGDAIERAAALGEIAGVIQLLDRHDRDNAALAQRFGVEHHHLPHELPGTPFQPIGVMDGRFWKEVALWWPARKGLIVAEQVGTNRMYTAGGVTRVGVHIFLRAAFVPRKLTTYAPEHLLVGHGAGVHGEAAAPALEEAIARSRRDLPLALLKLPSTARS